MSPRRSAAMAQCVQSVQEFLQDSFVPLVAALCSEEAERLARRNNLGFAELLKPFCRLTSEGRYPWGLGGGVGKAGPHPAGRGEARTPPPAPFSPFLSPSLGLPRLPAGVPFCFVGFGKLGFSPRRREAEGQGDGCV